MKGQGWRENEKFRITAVCAYEAVVTDGKGGREDFVLYLKNSRVKIVMVRPTRDNMMPTMEMMLRASSASGGGDAPSTL